MPKQTRDDPKLKKAVGRRLLAYRQSEGVDAKYLCEDYSFGPTAWSNWETGLRLPNVYDMMEFAEDSGLTLDYIYRGRFDALPFELRRDLRKALKLPEPAPADILPASRPAPEPRTEREHSFRRKKGAKE